MQVQRLLSANGHSHQNTQELELQQVLLQTGWGVQQESEDTQRSRKPHQFISLVEYNIQTIVCRCSPVTVVAHLCCGVGRRDEKIHHSCLQLLHRATCTNLTLLSFFKACHSMKLELLWGYIYISISVALPGTSLWLCHQTPLRHHLPPLQPAWLSRLVTAASDQMHLVSQPAWRSAQIWAYTSFLWENRTKKGKKIII